MDAFTISLTYTGCSWYATTDYGETPLHAHGRSREAVLAELLRMLRLHERDMPPEPVSTPRVTTAFPIEWALHQERDKA